MENRAEGYERIVNVFANLYRNLSRGPLPAVLLWALIVVVLATFALTGFGFGNVWNRTENRLVSIPGSESYRASELLAPNESTNYAVYLLVDGVDMEKQHHEVLNVLQTATKNLQEIPGVIPAGVLHPFAAGDQATNPQAAAQMRGFIAKNKRGFMVVTFLDLTQFPEKAKEIRKMTETEMRQIAVDMRSFAPQARGLVNDKDLNNEAIALTAKTDTHLATVAAVIAIALVMFLTSGSMLMTLLILTACVTAWAISRAFTNLVSAFTPPTPEDPALVTVISLVTISGYTILLLARSRAQLAVIRYTAEIPDLRKIVLGRNQKRRSRRAATGSPLDEVFAHALPLVVTSTALITLGLVTVAFFPASHLKWVALVSIASVWGCSLATLSLIPALLYLTARWLEMPRPSWHRNLFNRLSGLVHTAKTQIFPSFQRKTPPTFRLKITIVTVITVLMIIPIFGITWRTAGEVGLHPHSPTAKFHALRQNQYGNTGATPDAIVLGKTTSAEMATWAGQVLKIPGVANAIVSPENIGSFAMLDVTFKENHTQREAVQIVTKIRTLPANFAKLVTGQTANEIDFAKQLLRYLPPAVLVMAMAAFLVIATATRRLWLAATATATNLAISLASLGITTGVFQDGAGFFIPFLNQSEGVEPSVAVLLAGYGFATALDYQIYVISKSSPVDYSTQEIPVLLRELTPSRGILWTKSAVNLAILFSFLPVTSQGVKQPVFALALMLLGHATLNQLVLAPLLAPYPDQLPAENTLIWKN